MLDIAVQVANVGVRLDGKFLVDVLGSDEFTPLLPAMRMENRLENTLGMLPLAIRRGSLHGAIQIGFGDVQRRFHDFIKTVVGHVPRHKKLRSGNVIQLKKERKKKTFC